MPPQSNRNQYLAANGEALSPRHGNRHISITSPQFRHVNNPSQSHALNWRRRNGESERVTRAPNQALSEPRSPVNKVVVSPTTSWEDTGNTSEDSVFYHSSDDELEYSLIALNPSKPSTHVKLRKRHVNVIAHCLNKSVEEFGRLLEEITFLDPATHLQPVGPTRLTRFQGSDVPNPLFYTTASNPPKEPATSPVWKRSIFANAPMGRHPTAKPFDTFTSRLKSLRGARTHDDLSFSGKARISSSVAVYNVDLMGALDWDSFQNTGKQGVPGLKKVLVVSLVPPETPYALLSEYKTMGCWLICDLNRIETLEDFEYMLCSFGHKGFDTLIISGPQDGHENLQYGQRTAKISQEGEDKSKYVSINQLLNESSAIIAILDTTRLNQGIDYYCDFLFEVSRKGKSNTAPSLEHSTRQDFLPRADIWETNLTLSKK
ncbi:hypothetical protein BZA77DRAFT_389766 [Pyronema omphalodes]|nr:hypothetical protein BZA77DRAFT_389766 [Pyronema omphalodes]